MSEVAMAEADGKGVGEEVQSRLDWIRERYGRMPFVVEEMAKRPEIFLAYFEFSRLAVFEPAHLDRKTVELAMIAAGSALASEHCLAIHLEQARAAGASDDEIRETLLLGACMAFNKSQSVAFRTLAQMKKE
jgi:AhpD family alkylhydroperoxidase